MPETSFWRRHTSPLSITKALDFLPVEFAGPEFEQLQRMQNAPMPENGTGVVGDAGQTIAAMLGLAPFKNEPRHSFWKRNMPRAMPPSLQEPMGHDIELTPSATALRKAVAGR